MHGEDIQDESSPSPEPGALMSACQPRPEPWATLPALLRVTGRVGAVQLQEATALSRRTGTRLTECVVSLGWFTESELCGLIAAELSVPWASMKHLDTTPALVHAVPAALAREHCLIPVYARRERDGHSTVFVAIDDPTDRHALAAAAAAIGRPVKPMVASASEIRAAIGHAYGRAVTEITMPHIDIEWDIDSEDGAEGNHSRLSPAPRLTTDPAEAEERAA